MKFLSFFFLALSPLLQGAFPYPPKIDGARSEVYRTVDNVALKVHLLGDPDPAQPKPAILFFFGGGWTGGSPSHFEKQARHFAERGMICLLADYRVASRHQVKPVECVKDAKACFAWTRKNAERLGIDPARICAAGGSAGGHLAATLGTIPGFGTEERPNAMILFNPVTLLADLGEWKADYGKGRNLGTQPKKNLATSPRGTAHPADPDYAWHGRYHGKLSHRASLRGGLEKSEASRDSADLPRSQAWLL